MNIGIDTDDYELTESSDSDMTDGLHIGMVDVRTEGKLAELKKRVADIFGQNHTKSESLPAMDGLDARRVTDMGAHKKNSRIPPIARTEGEKAGKKNRASQRGSGTSPSYDNIGRLISGMLDEVRREKRVERPEGEKGKKGRTE